MKQSNINISESIIDGTESTGKTPTTPVHEGTGKKTVVPGTGLATLDFGNDSFFKKLDKKAGKESTKKPGPTKEDLEKQILESDKYKELEQKYQASSTEARKLNEALKALGMEIAFSSGADFGKMCAERAFIDKVKHKASLKIDEEGSRAAAATLVKFKKGGLSLYADRPFFFAAP